MALVDHKGDKDGIANEQALHQEDSSIGAAVHVSEQDDKRIRKKTDIHILTLLMVIYFLQIADKTIIGLTAVYGLRRDANLVGNQYSDIGAIGYYAQIAAQPLAAYLIVKIRYRIFMPIIVVCWAIALCGMSASTNFRSLMACRFLLGWFEAACLPLFSVITISFYRRSEQPLRVAAWYSTNGLATIICSALVYGLAHIRSATLYTYQIVYLFFGLLTFVCGVASYFWLSDGPDSARYLTPEDRLKAVERLKANQQGIKNTKFNFKHILEMVTELKFWIFMVCAFGVNIGAATSNVFGPIILQRIVGFTPDEAVLLNMPFGALQFIMIIVSSYLAQRFKSKGIIFFCFMVPVVIGVALLYALPKNAANQGGLLAGYYMISFLFAGNPLLVSWMGGNCGGQTKKSTYYTAYNAFSATGNVVAPYLFKAADAGIYYRPALQAVMAIFCVVCGLIVLQIFNLIWANKRKEKQRVSMGLPAKLVDYSMANKYSEQSEGAENAHDSRALDEDLTDKNNPYFIYIL